MIFIATDKNKKNPDISGTYTLPILLLFIIIVGMWYVCVVQMDVCVCARECGAQS